MYMSFRALLHSHSSMVSRMRFQVSWVGLVLIAIAIDCAIAAGRATPYTVMEDRGAESLPHTG